MLIYKCAKENFVIIYIIRFLTRLTS